jgi:glyoxylase-like metal-dependent hydrolase (beta-lactamase superfamily II)
MQPWFTGDSVLGLPGGARVASGRTYRQGPGTVKAYQDTSTMQRLRTLARGEGQISPEGQRYYAATIPDAESAIPGWRRTRVEVPNLTFDHELVVHLGHRDAHIMFLGRGNTAGDAVVWLPDEKTIVTGDLVVSPTPYAYGSFFTEWIEVLDRIRAMNPSVIVPGHGPVQRDPSYVLLLRELFSSVRDQVALAVRHGASLDDTRRAVKLDAFVTRFAGDNVDRAGLFQIGFVRPGVKRAFDEARYNAEQ